MKKTFRTMIICYFIIAAVFALASCNNKTALNAPENFTLNGGILTWNNIENAEGYTIDINGLNIDTGTNSLDTAYLSVGSNILKFKAVGNEKFEDSVWSQTVTFDKLAAPENITIENDDTLKWTASEGATGYYVHVLDAGNNELKKIDVNEISRSDILARTKTKQSQAISVKITDLELGKYTLIIIPYGSSEFSISSPAAAEYNRSMFETAFLSPSNSQDNIHLRIDFKFREDFTFDNYNFDLQGTDPIAEYYQMYNDFFNGTKPEKTAAVNKIGNDLIIQYYYFNGNDKIVLTTKNKAWEGYLNSYKDLNQNPPNDLQKIEGYYIGTVLDKDNYYTSSYNNPNVGELKGKEIFVKLAAIINKTVFTETFSYTVR